MIYLINEMSLPILMALLMGAYFGWSSFTREIETHGSNWMATGLLAFAIGCYAASIHLLPGRQGLYLEIALILFASYLIGCAAGYLSHKWAGLGFDTSGDMALAGGPAGAMHFTAQSAGPVVAKAAPAPAPVPTGPDDLTLIWGVGEKLARTLNTMGIDRFSQIAEWNEDDVSRFESHSPEFRGRVERDQWIDQCINLAAGWRPDNAVGERLVKN
jgi:predicted flap endonuclease-1-like 5' DNA nuclease